MSLPINFGNLAMAGGFDPLDPPPVVFHVIRVPCACGRSLDEVVYTFFPSAVFVSGECVACGRQTAVFAPGIEKLTAQALMAQFLAFLARTIDE